MRCGVEGINEKSQKMMFLGVFRDFLSEFVEDAKTVVAKQHLETPKNLVERCFFLNFPLKQMGNSFLISLRRILFAFVYSQHTLLLLDKLYMHKNSSGCS